MVEPGCKIQDTRVGKAVIIKASSVMTESILEDRVEVGPFAHLRPQTTLREKSKVGNFVEVKKSVLGKGSKANHLSYIGDTTIGEKVNVGAGTITCNYDGTKEAPHHHRRRGLHRQQHGLSGADQNRPQRLDRGRIDDHERSPAGHAGGYAGETAPLQEKIPAQGVKFYVRHHRLYRTAGDERGPSGRPAKIGIPGVRLRRDRPLPRRKSRHPPLHGEAQGAGKENRRGTISREKSASATRAGRPTAARRRPTPTPTRPAGWWWCTTGSSKTIWVSKPP